MCRFYIYIGPPDEDLDRALKLSAQRDPLAPRASPDRPFQHKDGWGYAVYLLNGSIAYYRSGRPIWDDPHIPPIGLAGVVHARAASGGEPLGAAYAHPFLAYTRDGHLLFVAHNGSVDKQRLAAELGKDPNRYSDSWLLALFLADRWDNPDAALEEALKYRLTALNLGILEVGPEGPKAYAYSYFEGGGEYYKLYIVRGRGWAAAVSSTLARYIEAEREEVELGRLYRLKAPTQSGPT
ncbi:MAG: class II glutamine amidotransferase [Thermoproteus sp. AZ2]|uniref:Class II glutamine amidotransferase n=1 Tax=Thermoproteus sp. AZ2 TaxID=1609232 RepID=A0ACC6UZF0_9CREN